MVNPIWGKSQFSDDSMFAFVSMNHRHRVPQDYARNARIREGGRALSDRRGASFYRTSALMDGGGWAAADFGSSTSVGMERNELAAVVIEPQHRSLAAEGDEFRIAGLAVG